MSRGMGKKKRERIRFPQVGDLWQYWLSPDVQFFIVVCARYETPYDENTWKCHVTHKRSREESSISPLSWPDARFKLLQRVGG